jgi:hypothetical protein
MILTAKEEAEKMVISFIDLLPPHKNLDFKTFVQNYQLSAGNCALKAVDMILDIKSVYKDEKLYNYWYEIQQELEKLKNEIK